MPNTVEHSNTPPQLHSAFVFLLRHELVSQSLERHSSESLGEYVRELILSRHVLKRDGTSGNRVTYEVMPDVDVLGAIVVYVILADGHR